MPPAECSDCGKVIRSGTPRFSLEGGRRLCRMCYTEDRRAFYAGIRARILAKVESMLPRVVRVQAGANLEYLRTPAGDLAVELVSICRDLEPGQARHLAEYIEGIEEENLPVLIPVEGQEPYQLLSYRIQLGARLELEHIGEP